MHRRGFTLVELSIVLVIIGLLIGGVLGAQSLVESVKLSRLINDLKQYEIAATQFHQKFKQYPGDSSYFTPAGNGDGAVSSNQTGCIGTYSNREAHQVWAHLSQSKMLSKDYPIYAPSSCGGNHSDADINSGRYWPHTDLDARAAAFNGEDTIEILATKAGSTNFNFYFITNTNQALALENKLKVQADTANIGLVNINGIGNCWDEGTAAIPCADSTAVIGLFYYYLAPP